MSSRYNPRGAIIQVIAVNEEGTYCMYYYISCGCAAFCNHTVWSALFFPTRQGCQEQQLKTMPECWIRGLHEVSTQGIEATSTNLFRRTCSMYQHLAYQSQPCTATGADERKGISHGSHDQAQESKLEFRRLWQVHIPAALNRNTQQQCMCRPYLVPCAWWPCSWSRMNPQCWQMQCFADTQKFCSSMIVQ